MRTLFLTADAIGQQSGGGIVTASELAALRTLGECDVWDREFLQSHPCFKNTGEPWCWDCAAQHQLISQLSEYPPEHYDLCHVYAGTFSQTLETLREQGTKITFTCAAHDIPSSKRAHEELGIPYAYPHLTEPDQWARYSAGMRAADVVICPSTVAMETCRRQGFTNRIEVIPHGCELPAKVRPVPKRFTVGYLGACSPDKGIVYLLKAWKLLGYRDATLILAGRDSTHPMVQQMWRQVGGGAVELRGWVDDVGEFYGRISCYVQPSTTEGFGIEVLEAMAHARPVVCSRGAGAVDLVRDDCRCDPFDAEGLAETIQHVRSLSAENVEGLCKRNRAVAEQHTWEKVRQRYCDLWRELAA